MNILIIPSWYPSADEPHTGIFFKEQALIYAQYFPEDKLALAHWGPNVHDSLFAIKDIQSWPNKILGHGQKTSSKVELTTNCAEYYQPRMTWTRKVLGGNVKSHIVASLQSLSQFENDHGKVDLIHAHVGYPGGFVAMKLSEKLRVPYMVTEHMGPFPFPAFQRNRNPVKELIEPLLKAGKVLSVSENLRQTLSQYNIESEVFHNFIDETSFQVASSPNEIFTFVHVGRLSPEKGQDILLKASSKLRGNFRLVIVGDGPIKEELESLSKDLDINHKIELKGTLSREGVQRVLESANAFVLPSTYENFPVAVMEALASGLPVIGSEVGGLPQIITKSNGVLVQPGSVDALTSAMQLVIDKKVSFDGQSIRTDFMNRFGSQNASSKLRSHYQNLLENS